MPDACSDAYYAAGDFPAEWMTHMLRDPKALHGSWEIIPSRSESIDALMSALGFGILKRSAVRNYKSRIDVCCNKESVSICTHLPMGMKKEGNIPLNVESFDQDDSDTGCVWTNEVLFKDGKLLQKRVSKLGTMYDVRCVFSRDPENKSNEMPIKLFRWTFVDKKGKVYSANRWSRDRKSVV